MARQLSQVLPTDDGGHLIVSLHRECEAMRRVSFCSHWDLYSKRDYEWTQWTCRGRDVVGNRYRRRWRWVWKTQSAWFRYTSELGRADYAPSSCVRYGSRRSERRELRSAEFRHSTPKSLRSAFRRFVRMDFYVRSSAATTTTTTTTTGKLCSHMNIQTHASITLILTLIFDLLTLQSVYAEGLPWTTDFDINWTHSMGP